MHEEANEPAQVHSDNTGPKTVFDYVARCRMMYTYLMAILAIILAHDPTYLALVAGLTLVLVGAAIRFWASGTIVKRRRLTVSGPYAYTRNPLYVGSFLGALGTFIMAHNWWLLLAFPVSFVLVFGLTIKSEEDFLAGQFGKEFEEYKRNVPVFLPRLTPYTADRIHSFSWAQVVYNREHKFFFASLLVPALILLREIMR